MVSGKGVLMASPPIRRALISVSDKSNLAEFARGLTARGVQIFSTGGTRSFLEKEGIAVQDVSQYTGFPEMMDGRLKTLHPKVHGGILCRHDNPEDMRAMAEHGILTFELVVVNLYPFAATAAKPGVTEPEAIEQIDIGGPALIRASAKNHSHVVVVVDTDQYREVIEELDRGHGAVSASLARRFAQRAYARTSEYDASVARYLAGPS